MLLLILFVALLLPISALADPITQAHRDTIGWHAIPDGYDGVSYWQAPGGTDAYTAGQIGEGLRQEFQRARQEPAPVYISPPLEAPTFQYNRHSNPTAEANRVFLDYLNHR